MDQIPFYLKPEANQPQVGVVDIFDLSNVDAIQYSEQSSGIWSDLSNETEVFKNWVYDGVSGTWTNVKSEIKEFSQDLKNEVGEVYSSLKWEVLFWVGAALLVVIVIAKTGILKQAAAFV